MWRCFSFALLLLAGFASAGVAYAGPDHQQLAQAQPAPAPPATPAPSAQTPSAPAAPAAQPADTQQAEEPIGSVATVTGKASVTRNDKKIPLAIKDDIYLNDVVQTAASSALGITFSDGTTFNLKANAQITIDNFVYEDGGKNNAGVFDVAKGTVAFVAAQVAKTGDMQITTPTATLGIRGTSGLVEVPAGATAASANNVNIKLYPDADGRVGRIEVNDRAGARLGFLTQGASGFAIRPGAGGVRFAAVPLTFSPQMIQRDQGFVRQVHSTQTLGRRVFDEQRTFRRANPGFVNPNRPIRQLQPGQQRPNGLPGQRRPNGLPGQPGQPPLPSVPNRPGQQQPGQLNRPGQQQPGQLNRPGQQQQPGAPNRQGQQQPGSPPRPGTPPRAGQQQPGSPNQPGSPPRAGQPSRSDLPPQPGAPLARPGLPNRFGVPGLQRAPGVQGAPAVQRPGLPAAPRRPAPAPQRGKPSKEQR